VLRRGVQGFVKLTTWRGSEHFALSSYEAVQRELALLDAGAPFEMYRELAFHVVEFLVEVPDEEECVNALRQVFEECQL